MHPLISLVSFIIFAAFVSLGEYRVIMLGFAMMCLIWLYSKQGPSKKAWIMLRRLRIFYFSILIIYLWFTPGEIVFTIFDDITITYEGLFTAAERILALSLLVFAVETLLRLTSRNSLLSGLYYLSAPLILVGLDRNQFILRIMLTLELVSSESTKNINKQKKPIKHYFTDITQKIADKITDTLNMNMVEKKIYFELLPLPRLWEWLWPLALTVLFMSVRL